MEVLEIFHIVRSSYFVKCGYTHFKYKEIRNFSANQLNRFCGQVKQEPCFQIFMHPTGSLTTGKDCRKASFCPLMFFSIEETSPNASKAILNLATGMSDMKEDLFSDVINCIMKNKIFALLLGSILFL